MIQNPHLKKKTEIAQKKHLKKSKNDPQSCLKKSKEKKYKNTLQKRRSFQQQKKTPISTKGKI